MITSTRHPRVQAVRRLHRRSARVAERRFVVEGPQAVREALAYGGLTELFVVDPAGELAVRAIDAGVAVTVVSDTVMGALTQTVNPQGVLGVGPLLDVPLDQALYGSPRLVTVLHAANDPGNAGTVIRTADAAGADAVVLTEGSVDPHNDKCVRAAAGSLWHLPVVSGAAVADVLAGLRRTGLEIVATSGTGEVDLDQLADAGSLVGPTAWLFGTEAHGLPDDVLAAADRVVRVPIHGRAESLNLGAAAAVCLYASARAQRAVPGHRSTSALQ